MTPSTARRPLAAVCLTLLATCLVAALTVTTSTAATVKADPVYQDYHQGYASKGTMMFSSPSMCLRWVAAGVLNYRTGYEKTTDSSGSRYAYQIDGVNLTHNTVKVNAFKRDGTKCTSTRTPWSKLIIDERMSTYSCSWNPTFSVSAPFSVSVSVSWPKCGDRDLARNRVVTSKRSSTFTMNNTGGKVTFKKLQGQAFDNPDSKPTWKCYAAHLRIGVQTAKASDWNDTNKLKICPAWTGPN